MQVKINTPHGNTKNIEIKEVAKQGVSYGPIMRCASTTRVNETGEKVTCKYDNIEIDMSGFMDDIAVIGYADTIKKGIGNCIWKGIGNREKLQYELN